MAEEKARQEQRAKEAAEAAERAWVHSSERASRTRSPLVESRPVKRARKEPKGEAVGNKAPNAADYANSVGFTCKGCVKRGVVCLWPRSLAQKRARACYTCMCTGHGCHLGGRLVSTIMQAEHPSERWSKTGTKKTAKSQASGSGVWRPSPERGEGSRAEQLMEQTLRELRRIHSLLEQVVTGQVVSNQQLSRMSLHLEMMAERGDGAWAMPSTPGSDVLGTPAGSVAEEDSEVDAEELEREVEDLGQKAENPEREPEVEGKGKDRAQ